MSDRTTIKENTGSWWTRESHEHGLSCGEWWTHHHYELLDHLVTELRARKIEIRLQPLEWVEELTGNFVELYPKKVRKCNATTFTQYRAWMRTVLYYLAIDKLRKDKHLRSKHLKDKGNQPVFTSLDVLQDKDHVPCEALGAGSVEPAIADFLLQPQNTLDIISQKARRHPGRATLIARAALNDPTLKEFELRRAANYCFTDSDCFDIYRYLRCGHLQPNALSIHPLRLRKRFTREELLIMAAAMEQAARRLRYRSSELLYPYWAEACAKVVREIADQVEPGPPQVTAEDPVVRERQRLAVLHRIEIKMIKMLTVVPA